MEQGLFINVVAGFLSKESWVISQERFSVPPSNGTQNETELLLPLGIMGGRASQRGFFAPC